ncbi:MAG TPA: ATP-dependent helicase, partial [Methanomassiliicoccales archaeon]|nr:ATP-dependent helicase [Methanomassiliicoccales archaeon]
MERVAHRHSKKEVLGLMEPLIEEWFTSKFEDMTEPQSYAIPIIHQRRNVLVSSPTGSGKTMTAFLSIINELFKYAKSGRLEERIYCVYVSPLKALANDINRNLDEPLREISELARREHADMPKIRVGVRTGDTSQADRQRMLKHPPHILITTPESLALALAAPKFREKFLGVEYVILDEIHEICDSKRGVFLSLTLERLQDYCKRAFTRIGLSATLAPIEEIAQFLVGHQEGKGRDVYLVEVKTRKNLDLKVLCPADDMTELSFEITNSKMYDMLKEMIDQHQSTIVFTNTRSGTENVVFKLKERGLESIEAHHGSLSKETRLDVEERLKNGQLKCVVSSTSLELGIDIGFVDLVCQIGSPKSVAKGMQRIGRSGHSQGRTSKGRMIVFEKDDLVECAVLCRAAHRANIDRVTIPENCLDVLAQSLVGMSLEKRWEVDDAYQVVRRSHCYRDLSKESFLSVLRYLGSKEGFEGVYSKVWYDEVEGRFGKRKGGRMIYFLNLGTIPEEANYKVVNERGAFIGDLSEKFVERLATRDVFVLGGKSYEFARAKGMRVFVKSASGRKPTVPSWTGEMLPRSFDLSMEVARFRRELAQRLDEPEEQVLSWLVNDFDIDHGSARSILSYFKEQRAAVDIIPDDRTLAIEGYLDRTGNHNLVFHFPFGRRVNDALSRAYAFQLTQRLGCNVSVSVVDDAFMISVPRQLKLREVEGLVPSKDLEAILRKAIRDSEIFKQRFRHTAARSFMILRNYKGREVSVNRQQVRSGYLLDYLSSLHDVPVIEETFREILEDVMDLANARLVLDSIEKGDMSLAMIDFSASPSPFAHNVVLAGISDIVLMEDRSSLLRELHRKVLSKVMEGELDRFEFEEEKVSDYFRRKIGRVEGKEDILAVLRRTGPLHLFKERGRSIYPYATPSKDQVDAWSEELLEEGRIASVYQDDVRFVAAEDLPQYAAILKRDRQGTELDQRALSLLGEERGANEIAASLGADMDKAVRSLHSLEVSHSIGRTSRRGGRWRYRKRDLPAADRERALDSAIATHLGAFGPSTVEELAFALGQEEDEVRRAVAAMVAEEVLDEGRFVVSERPQYMLKLDHLRLRQGDATAFDSRTVDSFRRHKLDGPFATEEECLRRLNECGMLLDIYRRVPSFDKARWEDLRSEGRVLLGRFFRGRVRYVLAEDAPLYVAAFRQSAITSFDQRVLDVLASYEGLSMRQLVQELGADKEEVKDSIDRLDRNMYVVRKYEEGEDWSRENVYIPFTAPDFHGDPVLKIVERFLRAYGPLPFYAIAAYTSFSADQVRSAL